MKTLASPESELEKLARISTDISRETISEFYASLALIAASIEAGDLERARQAVGLSIFRIAGIYSLIYLETPAWCAPSLRQQLENSVAALRKQISDINEVRLYEKQLERDAGNPPRPN